MCILVPLAPVQTAQSQHGWIGGLAGRPFADAVLLSGGASVFLSAAIVFLYIRFTYYTYLHLVLSIL